MPKYLRAKLDSIFWIASIVSQDMKTYSLNSCFKPILAMIKRIQIPFIHNGYSKPIKPIVLFFSGDLKYTNKRMSELALIGWFWLMGFNFKILFRNFCYIFYNKKI